MEAYTDLIDGYGKARMPDRALSTFRSMKERDVEPNVHTYTCLIGALARSGRVDEGKKLLDFMEESTGIRPTTVTYNAFITAMLGDAPPAAAGGATSSSGGGGGDGFVSEETSAYNQRVLDALGLLSRMVKKSSSKVRPDVITVSAIIDGLGRCSPPRIAEAKSIVEKLEGDGGTVSSKDERVGTALVRACGNAGDLGGATEAFRNIALVDVVALNVFLDSCFKCGDVKTALETFEGLIGRPRSQKRTSRDLLPDVITYTVLISGLLKMNTNAATDQARRLYEEMKSSWGIRPDKALVDIILTAMINGGSLGWKREDVRFTFGVLRDAESLDWEPMQYERRLRAVRHVLIGRMSEVWKEDEASYKIESRESIEDPLFKKKGWNKVDSGFRLWGQGLDVLQQSEDDVDEFLEAHGWNNVDSGFRLW